MRVVSWNVNGLRSIHRKGFLPWLSKARADIVGLQEVRARVEQLPAEVRAPRRWKTHFVAAERPGYSGVGLFSRHEPEELTTTLDAPEVDAEGRLQFARFGKLTVVNGYFPNGNGKDRDLSRIPFKLDFYRRLFARLEKPLRDNQRVLVMGDFNTAHQDIDLARPRENRETSGFRPEERDEFDRWIRAGWVDTFRHFNPAGGHYSWWSQRAGVREKNIGWRIDYVLATPAALAFVKKAAVHPDVHGSDHCPVSVDLDPSVLT
ncbi:exodeoxyribonuclease III [Corallococcus aberystwythensis]|uniref:Exodeoxyribonuclease III n=1 Tax=Corallococcus aberystwythensis TaxID=2316722 RepID=A0A3A8QUW1_9BACT|nr:exodeoxyribonuclease III [Corallococcus aberystwythensis]RKH72367.1 exodeoxyribonuclease III [Corallococcus aberystwythensis]